MPTKENGRMMIMVIDDDADDTKELADTLSTEYLIVAVPGGMISIQEALIREPDLILINGAPGSETPFFIAEQLRQHQPLAMSPLMILADMDAEVAQTEGLRCGADDCLVKPLQPKLLMGRIQRRLQYGLREAEALHRRTLMEQDVIRKNREVIRTREFFISALASIAETRDNETGLHIERTRLYISVLTRELKLFGPKEYRLSEADIRLIVRSAPLHDIGKIGIPDHILMKNGSLSPAEFNTIKTHTTIGHQALERAEHMIGYTYGFLSHAKDIVLHHHEWWDGTGYPSGLHGRQIPLSARMMAVADVYDALISNRVYKTAMTHEMAVSIIRSEKGTHFDPVIVDAFLAKQDRFKRIATRMIEDDDWRSIIKQGTSFLA